MVRELVTLPNALDAAQETIYAHDNAGRVLTVSLGSTVLATPTYDAAGELASVSYSNGSSLAAIGKDTAGRLTSLTWRPASGVDVVSTVGRTRAGTVIDESLGGVDPRPSGPNYVYDAVGRLVEAWTPGHHYTYDFTSSAPSGCPTGTRANAGLNTNRVRLLDDTGGGPVETGYCYDAADRLLATTGATVVTGVQYDSHGNTVQYISGGAVTSFGWDGAERNLTARVTGADPADVAYTRDAADRIIRRYTTVGDTATDLRYGYTGSGDTPDFTLAADGRVLTRSISLPGGVLHTWKPVAADQTWDHPTIRGDLAVTTGPTGAQIGTLRSYGPYGETDPTSGNDGLPDNQPGHLDYGWLGQHQRPHEHAGALNLVQMGARPYSPVLGRFLTVDPVEGGSANDYDYTNADPINSTDLDGQWPSLRTIGKGLALTAGVVGALACGASVICGIAVGAAAGAAYYAAKHAGTSQFTYRGLARAAAFGALGGGGFGSSARAIGWRFKDTIRFSKIGRFGGGTDFLRKGKRVFGIHMHSFRMSGRKVFLPHYHRRPGIGRHRPWQGI